MSVSTSYKTRIYSGLVIFVVLLVPVCNLGAIRFGFRRLFQNEAELVLFLFYAAPLWAGFILFIGFELYRQSVMKIPPGRHLVPMMAVGGVAFSGIGVLLCPVGPKFLSAATGEMMLISALICSVLGTGIRYLLWLRQTSKD
jgi:hypothetical protein